MDYFGLKKNNTTVRREVIAGLTTFFAMAYILGVTPVMLGDAGMPATGVFFATVVASGLACLLMGLVSDYPVALAPGLGIMPIFVYTIVLGMGNTWETGLAALLVSNIIFFLITISGLRNKILDAIPHDLQLAIGAGIGFFIAFIGLKDAGIIVADPSTLVALGPLTVAPALLTIIGLILIVILYARGRSWAVFVGLVITAIIGIIFTLFGFGAGNELMPVIPAEIISFNFDTSLFLALGRGFSGLFSNITNLVVVIFTILFVTFFDATGTLIPLANACGRVDDEGNIDGIERAFMADAASGIISAIFGTSTVTAFVESATGVSVGGKTGLTAVVTGICFLLALFLAPVFLALFTSGVTGAALIFVGFLMMAQLKDINWGSFKVIAAAAMTIISMILSYSITVGIALGFLVYFVASVASGEKEVLKPASIILLILFVIYLFLL